MKGKTLFWIVLFAALAGLGAGTYLLHGGGRLAYISVDGALYDTVDLTAAAEPYERTIRTEYGWNTLRIGRGRIEVVAADCPNQDCVKQGAISEGTVPIVCLPHRLVIEIKD